MKRQPLGSLAVVAAMTQVTHADLIAAWNFNDLSTVSSVPSNANQTSYLPSLGSGSLTLSGWTSRAGATAPHGISNFGGTGLNAVGSDPAGQALALQAGTTSGMPNNGAQATFQFNLLGYLDPIISFATQRTATGFNSDQLAYSTDGISFTPFGLPYNAATSFAVQTFDLSTVNALDNAATVYLRITFSGATSSSGNNRLDNIQMNATPTPAPEPATWALGCLGLAVVTLLRRKQAV